MKIFELLDTPAKWTQGAYARNTTGESVNYLDPNAVSWDLYAASAFCYDTDEIVWDQVLTRLVHHISAQQPFFTSLLHYNDTSSYEDIISICKAANV